MKRQFLILFMFFFVFIMGGCEQQQDNPRTGNQSKQAVAQNGDSGENLVWVYEDDEIYGGIMLTAYNGTDTAVEVPQELDGKSVTSLEDTFKYNKELIEVKLPDSVKGLFAAFVGCEALQKVNLPGELEEIGMWTFEDCKSLKMDVVLPGTLMRIGERAFMSSGILSVVIPEKITEISKQAFSCSDLQKVTFPNALKEIKSSAFDCTEIKEVTFPESLTFIGIEAFSEAPLEKVVLPASIEQVCARAFDCDSLSVVVVLSKDSDVHEFAFPRSYNGSNDSVKLYLPHDSLTLKNMKEYSSSLLQSWDGRIFECESEELKRIAQS